MKQAIIVRVDGTHELVEFTRETEYDMLSNAVGGYIERVPLPKLGADMWVNEEGKINGLAHNINATLLWIDSWGNTDWTAGDAVLTGGADKDGYILGLPDHLVKRFMSSTVDSDEEEIGIGLTEREED